MTSIYHILDKVPAIYPEDISIEYENLAKELVNSGTLRIDTDYYCNFVRFNDNNIGINRMFSREELTNKKLLNDTKDTLKALYGRKNKILSDARLNEIITALISKSNKLLPVSEELKARLARLFVQSAHPIVIKWLLLEKVEIFITYSNSIGDLMDIPTWKRSGQNSGMQSTDGTNVCIYVSCGGDPFAPNDKEFFTYGDGWAAVARLQIIAGQEIGHFADIKRDNQGRQISRHSANFACTKATPHVKAARIKDLKRCDNLLTNLIRNVKIDKLISLEEGLKFYEKHKVTGTKVWKDKIIAAYYRYRLLKYASKHKLFFIKRFKRDKYIGLMIKAMIADMKFNLAPVADVYKREDQEAEEAISCIEALARVPQQVMKWGYLVTKATMHDLYKIYYGEVIPSLFENYYYVTGHKFTRNYSLPKKSKLQFLINLFKKDKFKFIEVRELP